jgi:DNA-binding transcriptional LysR family regulator
MDTRKIRYFVAVAEELSFSRAALRLHMSQPPLSTQIKELETEMGVLLLHRTRQEVRLTDAGRVFLRKCKEVLLELDAAVLSARRASLGESGHVRLGIVASALYSAVPQLQARILQCMPAAIVSLAEVGSADQIQALIRDQLDIGVAHYPIEGLNLRSHLIVEEPYVAAVRSDHRLAGRHQISLSELADDLFICFSREVSPALFDSVIAACRESGFSPRIGHMARHMLTMLHMVRGGHGISLVPKSMALAGVPDLAFLGLTRTTARVRLGAAWRSDNDSELIRNIVERVVLNA